MNLEGVAATFSRAADAIEVVLKQADEARPHILGISGGHWTLWDLDPAKVRAAITRALTGEGDDAASFPVGRVHLDGNGIERVSNPWGFNSFTTAEGARQGAAGIARNGSTWYIWRLADGSFDYTTSGHPDLPGYPAELVERVTFHGYGKQRKAEVVREEREDDD